MNTVDVITNDGNLLADKVRYITYGLSNYLIYTFNEKDNEGYIKLFVNKIVDNQEYIISDYEWNDLKSFIPSLVKQIRASEITLFKDLSLNEIDKVNLDNARAFKLKEDIVRSIKKQPELEELNLLGKEIKQLFEEKPKQLMEEQSLNQLEEFLKNPIMEEPEEIKIPIRPNMDNNINKFEEDKNEKTLENNLKQENEYLKNEIENYKNKLNQIRAIIDK